MQTFLHKIKTQLNQVLLSVAVAILSFQFFQTYNQGLITLTFGLLTSLLIFVICLVGRLAWHDLRFWFAAYIYLQIFDFIKRWEYPLLIKPEFINKLFGSPISVGYLEFLNQPLSVITLSLAITPALARIMNGFGTYLESKLPFKISLIINIGISILLSLYYSIIQLLNHWSFRSGALDYGIFDQAIFLLSLFQTPASTIQQFTNLFFDHQHFSISVLAPLYWLGRGFGGNTLIFITPFLLITIPAIFSYYTFQIIWQKHHKGNASPWLISLTSFLLWYHPFTQAAIAFYFHEKYLMPTFFAIIVYFITRAIYLKNYWGYGISFLVLVLWMATKEDQWLFTLVFTIQVAFWGSILLKKFWDHWSTKTYFIASFISSLAYGIIFLPWFTKPASNADYAGMYLETKQALGEFFRTGNLYNLVERLNLFGGMETYLYQNFFIFDLLGAAFLPLNILGNYAERVLANSPSLVNPIFQYGVDVPIYVVSGVLGLYLWLKHKKRAINIYVLPFVFITYLIGFGAIVGWNKVYYLAPTLVTNIQGYKVTAPERDGFNAIRDEIPLDASLVTSFEYVPHFSARRYITQWPETKALPVIPTRSIDAKNNLDEFEYWLLPKRGEFNNKIQELQTKNYVVVRETDYQILLKKPSI